LADVYDFVAGKAYWLASARPTVRASEEPVRVMTAMERDAPMCHVDTTVEHAIEALDSRPGWKQCVVVTDSGVVLGVVTRDARGLTRPLADVMRPAPTTIRPDIALDEALAQMRKRDVTERVVTDPTGRLLGVLRQPS
jgi:CBS domain-containing protein